MFLSCFPSFYVIKNEESSFLFQSIQYIFFSRKSDSEYNAEDATIIFDKD